MIEQCLPGPARSATTSCCGSSCGCAPRATRRCGRRARASTSACASGSREVIAEGIASGELRDCDPERLADRALALVDGYGVRVVTGDPNMPLERARQEIWSALAVELGLPDQPAGRPPQTHVQAPDEVPMTTTPTPASADGLTAQEAELQARARAFVDEFLIPLRRRPSALAGASRQRRSPASSASRSSAGSAAACTAPSTAARAGRTSSGSSSRSSSAARPTRSAGTSRPPTTCWRTASPEQIDRWLRPALRGELHDAYAVTEADAGSDPSASARPPTRTDGGWRIRRREVVRHLRRRRGRLHRDGQRQVDGATLPTLFAVDRDAPGIEVVDDPPFTHNYPHGHPTMRFTTSRSATTPSSAGVGGGDDLQRAWFAEERLGIAARCGGAM